jgi:hypothetical protein
MKKIFFLFFLLIFLTSTTFAGTVNLPRTGQTKCYDTAGTEISCSGTGQDGDIQAGVAWPEPRFTDNGDETMTDNLTGLMWTTFASFLISGYYPYDTLTWQQSLDYVEGMNAGTYPNYGYTDWRLPNVNELESLVNANEPNSATWLNGQRFIDVQVGYYFSSTSYAIYTGSAWLISMWYGYVVDSEKSGKCLFWPVRSGQCGSLDHSAICLPKTGQIVGYASGDDGDLEQGVAWPSPRFTDHGNRTVTDNLTGLMWTKYARSDKKWQEALDYCNSLTQAGYTDWRLPNINELHSLTDYSRCNPALPSGHPFTNVQGHIYWSSTTSASVPDSAWIVDMWDGSVNHYNKSDDYRYVWPVRGGQIQSSECSTWTDVVEKYQAYKNDQATLRDLIECYREWRAISIDR